MPQAICDSSQSLTLAIIARNEERVIARCLGSARSIASEMIVVDTGSNDATPDLASKSGAKVIHHPWQDDFSTARNRALSESTGKWILVLDADEYLPPESAAAITELLQKTPHPDRAFHLVNKSSSDSGRTGASGHIVRLFPNDPRIRYEWPVHEQVVTSLQRAGFPVIDTNIEIIHTGYSDPSTNAAKQSRNLRILEKFLASESTPQPRAVFLKGGALLDLKRIDEAHAAYLEAMDLSPAGGTTHEAARVRVAGCLSEKGEFVTVLAINPPGPPPTWHPELLVLKGLAAHATGDLQAALSFYHQALASPPRPLIPAYDPVRIAIRAVMGIASLYEKNDPGRAVNLLRLASESAQTGSPVSLGKVLAIQETQ